MISKGKKRVHWLFDRRAACGTNQLGIRWWHLKLFLSAEILSELQQSAFIITFNKKFTGPDNSYITYDLLLSLIHLCRYHISMIHNQQDTPCTSTLPLPPPLIAVTHRRTFATILAIHPIKFGLGAAAPLALSSVANSWRTFSASPSKKSALAEKVRPVGNFKCPESIFGRKQLSVHISNKISSIWYKAYHRR